MLLPNEEALELGDLLGLHWENNRTSSNSEKREFPTTIPDYHFELGDCRGILLTKEAFNYSQVVLNGENIR